MTSGLFWGCYVNERGCAGGKCFFTQTLISADQLSANPISQSWLTHVYTCFSLSLWIIVILDSTHISASSIFLAHSYHSALTSRWLLSRSFIDISHPQAQEASANEIQHVSTSRGNQEACKCAIHKATGKRNVVLLVNLLNLLLALDSLGEE